MASMETSTFVGEPDATAMWTDSRAGRYDALISTARVMIVDDAQSTVDVLKAFLIESGYTQFVTTSDATAAVDMIRERKPDALLLDVHMPEISGLEILEIIRRDPELHSLPVIILTAATESEVKLQALSIGASDFLAKPVDPSELALRLRNTLASRAYLDHLASHDPVTGLLNAAGINDVLSQVLHKDAKNRAFSAVLVLSIDRLRGVFETMEPEVSAGLLEAIKRRMEEALDSAPDLGRYHLGRYSIDEFVLIVADLELPRNAEVLARKLAHKLGAVIAVGDQSFAASASIGIAISPSDGTNAASLTSKALAAASRAKSRAGGRWEFHADDLNAETRRKLRLEPDLRTAINEELLELYYQPKMDLRTGALFGCEALCRWSHPEFGFVSPPEFISLAEEAGLIGALGEWVLYRACADIASWHQQGGFDLNVSVNVSSTQLEEGLAVGAVERALEATGLGPAHLTLELTETVMLKDPEVSVSELNRLRELGASISIDDFGTGYSSLSYLTRLPADEIKIDRAFISPIGENDEGLPIVAAIIAMAHRLNCKVVAEGVETKAQLNRLRALRCDVAQGYLIGKPMPAPQLFDRLGKWRARRDARSAKAES